MDIRETIVKNILITLKDSVTDDILELVKNTLIIQLEKYEVQERTTEIVTTDTSAEGMLRKYIATKRIEGKAESTIRRYYYENIKLINYFGKKVNEISTYDIRLYLSLQKHNKNLSNRTLDGMRRCYSSFFVWLITEGYITQNPCSSVNKIKYRKQIKKPFSTVELIALRDSCKNIRDLALVEFLYSTGCRVSEVSTLNISDVDLSTGECKVLGKGNKERIVYLSDVAQMRLKKYFFTRTDKNTALFCGKGTKRLTKGGIEAILKRIGKMANVKNTHPHRFRRTLATNLLDKGMSIQEVANILGHSNITTTQIYCYINQDNVKTSYYKYSA